MAKLIGGDEIPKRSTMATYSRRRAIGRAIQKVRVAADIDIATAAIRSKVSVYTWQRWERGEAAVPLERVPDILRALKVTSLDSVIEMRAAA